MLVAKSLYRVFDIVAALLAAEVMGVAIPPPAVQVPGLFAPWSSAVVIGAKRGNLGRVLDVSRRVAATGQLAAMQLTTSASLGVVGSCLLAIGNRAKVLAAGGASAALLVCARVEAASVGVAVMVALQTSRTGPIAIRNRAQMVLAEGRTGLRRRRAFGGGAGMRLAVVRGLIIGRWQGCWEGEAAGDSAREEVLFAKCVCSSGVVAEPSRLVAAYFGAGCVVGADAALSLSLVFARVLGFAAVLGAIPARCLLLAAALCARRHAGYV